MPAGQTTCHAKYFAHELIKRCAASNLEKLAGTLVDAQVDLNPHQVSAALFAFKSPLSKGALLADEVGLGKTIEAGILLPPKMGRAEAKGAHQRPLQPTQAVESGITGEILPPLRDVGGPQLQSGHQTGKGESLQSGRAGDLLLPICG